MNRILKISFAALTALSLAACADDPEVATTGDGAGMGGGYGSSLDPSSVEFFNVEVGDRVFFALDSSSVDSAAAGTLNRQAQWLNANPSISAVIEGHADERGTREYNLGLGARRAQAARDYLVSQGVDAGRLRVVSYGKERPVAVCANESCWSQNRRAVTMVAGGLSS